MNYLFLTLGLVSGNFVWQIFTDRKWRVAVERSFFQAAAVFACWWTVH
jgi:hypothetical protein